jgi:hypothetical protein
MSRPVNPNGKKWPWDLPAMIRIKHSSPWTNEKWRCTFTDAEPPYNDFTFSITGSVTGNDGKGSSLNDFKSNSGKVIIKGGDAEEGGDWHLKRSFKVLKTKVDAGESVTWRTFSISKDYFNGTEIEKEEGYPSEILFQGIPNSNHLLKLKSTGRKTPEIKEITVYRPLLNYQGI